MLKRTIKIIYNVFASSTYNLKTGQMIREVHQDYITVTKKGNRFYWGEQNYFYVYNESVNHDGFKTTTRTISSTSISRPA